MATTIVGSSPICHTSTSNFSELHRQEAVTASLVDLLAISIAAAKEMIQHLKQDTVDAWCTLTQEKKQKEDASCALSQETENHQLVLLQQRVTFEEQLDIEKRKKRTELVKRINTSERYISTPRGTHSGGANHAMSKPLAGAEKQDEASETDLQVRKGESDSGVQECIVVDTRVSNCSTVTDMNRSRMQSQSMVF